MSTVTKPRSRAIWWVGGILLVFVLIVGGLLYAAWMAITGFLGGIAPTDTMPSTRTEFTPHVRDGQVEFDLKYGREATGVARFIVSDPDTDKPIWVLAGPGQNPIPKIVYGQVPTDPVFQWTQEFPADGAAPADIRGRKVKVTVNNRFQVMFGPGHEFNERVIDLPAQ